VFGDNGIDDVQGCRSSGMSGVVALVGLLFRRRRV
jgi:hypothetical protein